MNKSLEELDAIIMGAGAASPIDDLIDQARAAEQDAQPVDTGPEPAVRGRKSRAQSRDDSAETVREERQSARRFVTEFRPPESIPTPPPKPGVVYRWVRVSTLGDADVMNFTKRMQDGFTPVRASEMSAEFIATLGIISGQRAKVKDTAEYGGLMLCHADEAVIRQREAYYAQQGLQNHQTPRSELAAINRQARGGMQAFQRLEVETRNDM